MWGMAVVIVGLALYRGDGSLLGMIAAAKDVGVCIIPGMFLGVDRDALHQDARFWYLDGHSLNAVHRQHHCPGALHRNGGHCVDDDCGCHLPEPGTVTAASQLMSASKRSYSSRPRWPESRRPSGCMSTGTMFWWVPLVIAGLLSLLRSRVLDQRMAKQLQGSTSKLHLEDVRNNFGTVPKRRFFIKLL
jgi:hypothetical protein